jgi:peptide/nickel transport system permease protein
LTASGSLGASRRWRHPLTVLWRGVATIWANTKARIGIVVLLMFLAVAALAPVLAPHSPEDRAFPQSHGPSGAHWLGTTAAGQDVLSQLIYGTRVSLFVGIVAGALSTLVAIIVGLSWGYMRSFLGDVVNFLVNLFLVIPALPLMIVIAAYLQNGGIGVIILVVVITGWAWGARVLRSQMQSLRSRDFVTAAIFSGERPVRVVFSEILPNMTSLIVGSFFAAATAAVLAEAGLEFLGLGDSRTVSWGTMLFWAQNSNALLTGQWVLLLAPGLCIAVLATGMALVIFGVDALSNPKLREAG